MKKSKFYILLGLLFAAGLSACGNETNSSDKTPSNPPVENSSNVESSTNKESSSNTESSSNKESSSNVESSSNIESTTIENSSESKLDEYKATALAKLDEIVKPYIDKIADEDLKAKVLEYYNKQKQSIEEIENADTAKDAASKVVSDTKEFVIDTLKPLALEKINGIINPLIEEITHEELKNSVKSFYNQEVDKLDGAESIEEVVDLLKEIVEDTKQFIKDETEKIIIVLKDKAIEELDPYVTALIEKIPYEPLKEDTLEFYNDEKVKLEDVNSIEGVKPCVDQIKIDLEEFALSETKKIAVSALMDLVNSSLEKLPNDELREDLQAFALLEQEKLNAVDEIQEVVPTLELVIEETKDHVTQLLANTIKDYVARLTQVETTTAYDYLPESMNPRYSANIVDMANISSDYSNFVNVSSINQAGFGDQWQMVVENIEQSLLVSKVYNVAQTALNAAGNAIDIYLENSYAEEMSYSFTGENYSGLFEFKDAKLVLNLTITKDMQVPVVGNVKPVFRMEYDLLKDAKGIYISLGDAYKIKYVISENIYEMATTYGVTIAGKNGSRSSYLSIDKDENENTIGHIYEYTTYEGSDMIKAAADFYVTDNYVSVVGNKASGLIAFDGYVNELYLANQGRLIGYEVREELTIAGVKGTYNTLWFNLWDIQGINSIKVLEKSKNNPSEKSTVDVYVNGSSKLLSPTYNKLIVKTSRKYDIELRSRYYYSYDAINDKYIANEVKVPMMFIQEGDNYNSFVSDMKNDNNLTASVTLNSACLDKILSDYDTLIDLFILNKELMSSEAIIDYLKIFE